MILRMEAWIAGESSRRIDQYRAEVTNRNKLMIVGVALAIAAAVALYPLKKHSILFRSVAFVSLTIMLYFTLEMLGYSANFFAIKSEKINEIDDAVRREATENRERFLSQEDQVASFFDETATN